MRRKRAALYFILIFVVTVSLEGIVRVLSWLNPEMVPFEYKTRAWHAFDNPHWEVWHIPHAQTTHVRSCFTASYSTNSFGMRDKERSLEKLKPRVAVLGDSVVEGLGVNDAQTFTRILEEKYYSQKAEFLNFGTSGHFSTTQELLLYQHLVRQFKPDLVILAFFNVNDVAENSWWYWQSVDSRRRRPYFVKGDSDRYDLFYPNDGVKAGLIGSSHILEHVRNALTMNSYLFRLAYAAYFHFIVKSTYAGSLAVENVYNAHPDENWSVSWDVTEYALKRLKEEVDRDHAKLIILQIADHLQVDPARATTINSRDGYSTFYPNQRIERLATQLEVPYFSLYEPFVAVRVGKGMKPPYFWFTCDPHWNPQAHEVAAGAISQYLQSSGLLPGTEQ